MQPWTPERKRPAVSDEAREASTMSTPNGHMNSTENPDDAGSEACCAPGCGCDSANPTGRARWLVGIVILAVTGVLVARAMVRDRHRRSRNNEATFASTPTPCVEKRTSGVPEQSQQNTEDVSPSGVQPKVSNETIVSVVGREIETLASLNEVAAQTDAAFVYLPSGKKNANEAAPAGPLDRAVRTLKARQESTLPSEEWPAYSLSVQGYTCWQHSDRHGR